MEVAAEFTARSLFVVYKQLPEDAQQAFKQLLNNEAVAAYKNAEWLPYSTDTLKEIWEAPAEDYWDDLYEKQHSRLK